MHRLGNKELRALSRGFGRLLKPNIENYFTAFSLDYFIRLMIKVFPFHIDLTLTAAMVT